MQRYIDFLLDRLALFGLDLRKTGKALRGLKPHVQGRREFKRQQRSQHTVQFPFGTSNPQLVDRFAENGSASGHYFHQDIWAARKVLHHHPENHIDVGSRVDGFVAHVAVFRPITVIDIRPQPSLAENITFVTADLMAPPPAHLGESCDSLSCLHALEHFGLGRYGDPINPQGHIIAFENLTQLLRPGGKFYFSVPMGPQRINFDAHRVMSLSYLQSLIEPRYQIDDFAYVDDAGVLHDGATLSDPAASSNFGCRFGCALFELTKR